ncbi:MAG: hypothetical protein ACPLZ8_00975 [Fervidicoccaceae archaeon]
MKNEVNDVIETIRNNPTFLISTLRVLIYLLKKKEESVESSTLVESISDNFSGIELRGTDSNLKEETISDIRTWSTEEFYSGGYKTNLISFLVEKGVVDRKERERIVVCPICGSPKVRVELRCPICGSWKVDPDMIVQHLVCGYTGPKKSFVVGEKMVCPSCRLVVEEKDLKVLGKSFFCESCGKIFRTPKITFICLNYNTTLHVPNFKFEPIEAKMKKLYGYNVTEKGEKLLYESTLIADALGYILSSSDVIVKRGEDLKNFLKENYKLKEIEFSAVFIKEKRVVALDIAGRDPLPFLFKAGILSTLNIPYLVISHPSSLRALTEAERTYGNLHVVNITEMDLNELKNQIISLLSEKRTD